jgi:hypothetical protein
MFEKCGQGTLLSEGAVAIQTVHKQPIKLRHSPVTGDGFEGLLDPSAIPKYLREAVEIAG